MKAWIISVVAVVLLISLLELLLTEGETKKYIKGILGIAVFAVIISPLPKLLNGQVNIPNGKAEETVIADVYDSAFFYEYYDGQMSKKEETIELLLSNKGIENVEVTISFGVSSYASLEIYSVLADASNIVINPEIRNIDITDLIKYTVAEVLKVEEERIVVCGR